MNGVAGRIYACFRHLGQFTLKEAYEAQQDIPRESVRARIYENLGSRFERVAKGIYKTLTVKVITFGFMPLGTGTPRQQAPSAKG